MKGLFNFEFFFTIVCKIQFCTLWCLQIFFTNKGVGTRPILVNLSSKKLTHDVEAAKTAMSRGGAIG